jgi:hypothetical protein
VADTFPDARLELILVSVGEHLVVDAPLAAPARAGSPWPRRLAIAAAILVVVLVTTVAIAPVREAVADWLGIGHTRVVKVEGGVDTTGLPSIEDRLTPISHDEAETVLSHPLPQVEALGDPDLVVRSPEGGVIMGWSEGDTTLWVHREALEPGPFFDKLLNAGERVERVTGVGEDALYIEGTHILETPGRKLAARSVLLWVDVGVEYRLESNLDRDQMIELARSTRAG